MIGIVLDSVLMLLLVAALGYGVRLEKKLTALRAGQLAFAGAVTELNSAAGRAESALQSLRAAGEEADMLHDRILKARAVKQELDILFARAPSRSPSPEVGRDGRVGDQGGDAQTSYAALHSPTRTAAPSSLPMKGREITPVVARELPDDEDRALRMAALAERIQGMASPKPPARTATAPTREPRAGLNAGPHAGAGAGNVSAILTALTANQAAQQSLNKARRSLDEDLFAA